MVQYLLYGPLLANGLYSLHVEGNITNNWCLHILFLCFLRVGVHIAWSSYSTMLFLTRNRRILQQGIDFKQIDMEWEWYGIAFVFNYFIWGWGKKLKDSNFFSGITSYYFKL